jgi:hypothetical protein
MLLPSSRGSRLRHTDAVENRLFREKVLRWIQRIHDHEARESDLLEDAFIEDLEAGD